MSKIGDALKNIENERSQSRPLLWVDPDAQSIHLEEKRRRKKYILSLIVLFFLCLMLFYRFVVTHEMTPEDVPFLEQPSVEDSLVSADAELIPGSNDIAGQPVQAVLAVGQVPVPVVEEPVVVQELEVPFKPFYSIQFITFKTEKRAKELTENMVREKQDVFVYPSEPYYLVCYGRFETKKDANKKLRELKKAPQANLFKDAYVRFIDKKF